MKNPKKLLIPIFLCFFLLAVCGAQGVKEKQSTAVEIVITVEEGEVKCPDAVAHYEEDVVWKSKYAFAVDFGKKTPFKEFKFKAKKEEAQEGKGAKVIFTGARDTDKKWKFKYFVAVCIDGEILTLDPDLEIMP